MERDRVGSKERAGIRLPRLIQQLLTQKTERTVIGGEDPELRRLSVDLPFQPLPPAPSGWEPDPSEIVKKVIRRKKGDK